MRCYTDINFIQPRLLLDSALTQVCMCYRKVWSAMSPSAIASKLRLIDSLSLLLRGSAGFVGSVGVVTLLLPMLECAQDGQTDVRRRVELKVRELQSAWKDTVWTDVQSQLIQVWISSSFLSLRLPWRYLRNP